MASALRIMLQTGVRTNSAPGAPKALLAQLIDLDAMPFLDSVGEADPFNLLSTFNLTVLEAKFGEEGGAKYIPVLDGYADGNPRLMPDDLEERFRGEHGRPLSHTNDWPRFDLWWTLPVIKDAQYAFTRQDLVLRVANKDGGSHVDPTLPVAYADLSRNNSLGWIFDLGGQPKPLGNPVPASIRQIVFEVDASVSRQFPKLTTAP
jgi:hypothetical protein